MIATVWRIVGDPHRAPDVLQEVLAAVWAKLERIDRHPNPQAYIMRICLSRSCDHLRARRRRREQPFTRPSAAVGPQPGDAVAGDETAALVREAIAALPPKQAQAVLLRAMDDCSYSEIADILRCSEATARSHFSKGVGRLRKTLSGLDT